ncbi:Lipopolysaccharide core biosynthesis glycosyltransferase WaaE [Neochlamydia sp. TUME1]|uniref:glycosyltransferase family 2 protein n=1 Tax=Neochlamydia sp. TUME1 TaxID=1478174 RepID=UPI00057E800B|nr:glycosyltransferase family 2 protein [Neochlamydia sp. TUME1]KIC73286.1 Lipopolysaccharide core biosynthesis glycosyltransferase WaaE [Neochlamydia sp. TUME1]
MIPISVTILTKNSCQYLAQVLDSVSLFDEVLIYDTGSVDDTIKIAKSYSNVRVILATFEGFGPTHNKASAYAKHDWILSLDSDELATPAMIQEILATSLQEKVVYSFPRHNYFNNKFIRWCGWYPDRQYRLYNRKETGFTNVQVHEAIIVKHMQHVPLNSPLIHYSYNSIADFLSKMQTYSTLFAEQNKGKKTASLSKALTHGIFSFLKSYILKRGFMGGYEGFIISAYNGHTAFYKYLKLYEANRKDG